MKHKNKFAKYFFYTLGFLGTFLGLWAITLLSMKILGYYWNEYR